MNLPELQAAFDAAFRAHGDAEAEYLNAEAERLIEARRQIRDDLKPLDDKWHETRATLDKARQALLEARTLKGAQ